MKNAISRVLILLFATGVYAQQGINYKALIKDNLSNVVANQIITVQFQILKGTETDLSMVYQETHTPTTDVNGLIVINIGEGTVDSGVFNDIDWGSDTHFLNTKIDTGAGLVDMDTKSFNTVPYALQAKTATTANMADNGSPSGGLEGQVLTIIGGIPTWTDPPAYVGQLRDGGVVFWVNPTDNTHGLVCSLSDYTTLEAWGCEGTDLPSVPNIISGPIGSGSEIGDGSSNTNGILATTDCPTSPAALASRSYGSEWFLPSVNDLKAMHYNKTTLEAVAGFIAFSNFYWSSTEYDDNNAWIQDFNDGSQSYSSKESTNSVRAVRMF